MSVQKVYIVIKGWDYESNDIEGVFEVEESAKKEIIDWEKDKIKEIQNMRKLKDCDKEYWNVDQFEDLPTGRKINGEYIYIQEEVVR